MCALIPINFTFHSIRTPCNSRRSLLFRIDLTEHCIYDLLSFFISALIVGAVDYLSVFRGATTPAEPAVLLFLPQDVHFLFLMLKCSPSYKLFRLTLISGIRLAVAVLKWTESSGYVSGGSKMCAQVMTCSTLLPEK